jgi:translation initiation factor RLI1
MKTETIVTENDGYRGVNIDLPNQEIVINVIGHFAVGKSAIQEIIANSLKNYGFNVDINVNICNKPNVIIDKEARLRSIITRNKKITINEINVNRNLL